MGCWRGRGWGGGWAVAEVGRGVGAGWVEIYGTKFLFESRQ